MGSYMKKTVSQFLIIALLFISIAINNIPLYSSATQPDYLNAYTFVSKMNTGWNLGNSLDSYYGNPTGDANLSQETIWGNPKVTKEQLDHVKSLGFDVIRVPVSWHTHTYRDANGTIHIYPEWLNRVHEVVDYCIDDGFFVIINTHHDGKLFHCGVSENEFVQVKNDAASIWNEIASSFSKYDSHLIFESFNEVDNLNKPWNFEKRAANQMNELNQIFVDTIRSTGANNSQRLLMVPTLLDQFGAKYQKAFVLPKDSVSGKIIVTVHFYAKSFDQSLDNSFSNLMSFSKVLGAPIIIGEWGTTDKFTPSHYRSVHASNYIARANKFGLRCIYWDNGSDYAIIDRRNLTSNKEMVSAIMNPKEYNTDNDVSLSDFSNYLYMTVNQDTGALLEDKHWGSILVNIDGNGGYPIPSGSATIYVGLVANDNMSNQRIHYVYFLDDNNNLTGFINDNYGFLEKTIDIPSGSTKVRIGANNSYSKTSAKEYKVAINNGNFRFVVNFY